MSVGGIKFTFQLSLRAASRNGALILTRLPKDGSARPQWGCSSGVWPLSTEFNFSHLMETEWAVRPLTPQLHPWQMSVGGIQLTCNAKTTAHIQSSSWYVLPVSSNRTIKLISAEWVPFARTTSVLEYLRQTKSTVIYALVCLTSQYWLGETGCLTVLLVSLHDEY